MYYPYFITYILTGFALSLALFLWALNSGQFTQQQRARFLALEESAGSEKNSSGFVKSKLGTYEIYAIFIVAFSGLLISGGVLLFAVFFS